VAASLDAARAAAARSRAPPGGGGAAGDASQGADDDDDPSDALDNGGGGGEGNTQLLREYMRELGGAPSSSDGASPPPPFSVAAAALLVLSAAGGALAAPLADAADALALRSATGCRLLATGALRRRPRRRDAVRVDAYERVAGCTLYNRKHDDHDADACTAPPLFVAALGEEQLTALAAQLRCKHDDACGCR
jgi:hypothetical protein